MKHFTAKTIRENIMEADGYIFCNVCGEALNENTKLPEIEKHMVEHGCIFSPTFKRYTKPTMKRINIYLEGSQISFLKDHGFNVSLLCRTLIRKFIDENMKS